MKWKEARKLFPNQFLLVSILDDRLEEDKKIVDEVAIIRPEKMKMLIKSSFMQKKEPWSTIHPMKTCYPYP